MRGAKDNDGRVKLVMKNNTLFFPAVEDTSTKV